MEKCNNMPNLKKKGKRSLPENYRPVSLTAIFGKILEHILVSQIWNHFVLKLTFRKYPAIHSITHQLHYIQLHHFTI